MLITLPEFTWEPQPPTAEEISDLIDALPVHKAFGFYSAQAIRDLGSVKFHSDEPIGALLAQHVSYNFDHSVAYITPTIDAYVDFRRVRVAHLNYVQVKQYTIYFLDKSTRKYVNFYNDEYCIMRQYTKNTNSSIIDTNALGIDPDMPHEFSHIMTASHCHDYYYDDTLTIQIKFRNPVQRIDDGEIFQFSHPSHFSLIVPNSSSRHISMSEINKHFPDRHFDFTESNIFDSMDLATLWSLL